MKRSNAESEAIEFLRLLAPEGPWHLVAIEPDSHKIESMRFEGGEEAKARACIEKRRESWNLYFQVNSTDERTRSKAAKRDVTFVRYLQVDLDPAGVRDLAEERSELLARLLGERPEKIPEPTFILDSGGGYWGLWRLAEPIDVRAEPEAIDRVERCNAALAKALRGDNCHDISRLARLPGTVNLPDAGKRTKGRKPAPTKVVQWSDVAYPIGVFEGRLAGPTADDAPRPQVEPETITPVPLRDLSELDALDVSDALKSIIVEGRDPSDPDRFGGDRSRAVFLVACELVRSGCPPDKIAGVLIDARFAISAHCMDQKKPAAYAARQVARAIEEVGQQGESSESHGKSERRTSPKLIRDSLEQMKVRLRFDEFSRRELVSLEDRPETPVSDSILRDLRIDLSDRFGFTPPENLFFDVVGHAARRNAFHPVRDYLNSLEWDGRGRVDKWLCSYLGAADDEYTRAVGMLWLVAAVRRVRSPGCKFDEMLILESSQGAGKSSALAIMAVKGEWFCDDLPLNTDGKKVIEQTEGKWIVEAAELKGMRGKKAEHLKALLSRTADRSRLAYGRITEERPRQFVMAGTTNDRHYLEDETGARRFWPVELGRIDLKALRRDRDQLWAEAAHIESRGEPIRLDPSLYEAAARQQLKRDSIEEHPWFEILSAATEGGGDGWVASEVLWDLVDLGEDRSRRTQTHMRNLGAIMRRLGFESKQLRRANARVYGWARGPKSAWHRDPLRKGGVPAGVSEDLPF